MCHSSALSTKRCLLICLVRDLPILQLAVWLEVALPSLKTERRSDLKQKQQDWKLRSPAIRDGRLADPLSTPTSALKMPLKAT